MKYELSPEKEKTGTWKKEVQASFRKVVAFDLLFMGLGMLVGAGIITAILFS